MWNSGLRVEFEGLGLTGFGCWSLIGECGGVYQRTFGGFEVFDV